MIEIGLVIAVVMSIGVWLKKQEWYPNSMIPLAIVFMAVAFNLANAFLFHGDLLMAGKLAFIEALAAVGIHSGMKNSFESKEGQQHGKN
ncbi:hypothetical protein POF51_13470 [Brevibacillus sp. AG]|uniref:hypothetical protein n=1 Tax=Brevibacillus sp. AG TaxID=3020891 RepID=UPI00232E840B|nr:hypothetical protein [Brevibacillus sp. AG]MDC0761710.1 hypothetical protein [Brevibacillus sp. AG]